MPPTVNTSVVFLPVSTRFPLRLSDAVIAALPKSFALIAFSRSPTVSVPVEVYVVMFLPALIVIVPPERIPRSDSGVLIESAFVPVPVAATGMVCEGVDEAVVDDDGWPVLPDKTFWISCESCVLTRFRALWLAILARPLPNAVSAEPMALMTELVAASELSFCLPCCQ